MEGSEEVTITMSRKLWIDVLIDVDWAAQELDDSGRELESGTYHLERELNYKGVTI